MHRVATQNKIHSLMFGQVSEFSKTKVSAYLLMVGVPFLFKFNQLLAFGQYCYKCLTFPHLNWVKRCKYCHAWYVVWDEKNTWRSL